MTSEKGGRNRSDASALSADELYEAEIAGSVKSNCLITGSESAILPHAESEYERGTTSKENRRVNRGIALGSP